LVNGSQGIAVGMATQIPSHNLGEVVDAIAYLIDHPNATVDELMRFIPGPDFPTGGIILGRDGIRDAYRTGRGSVKLRAVATIEEHRSGYQIVVSEIPYQTSVEVIADKIRHLVDEKLIEGVRDMKNFSAGSETRFVIELKRDANPNVVLNNLYRLTPLQTSFAIQMLALVDGVPRTLNLLGLCQIYVDHQREVVRRRSEFRLGKARERLHIVEGLLACIDQLDAVIATIRASEDRAAARAALMAEPFGFSELQANHILDMTLGRLTRLGREELDDEAESLRATIAELEAIITDDSRLLAVVKEELLAAAAPYRQPRRTRFEVDPGDFAAEDLIEDEPIVVLLSRSGYIKAVPESSFKAQGRGGRGVVGAKVKEEDEIAHVISSSMLSRLLVFTSRGRVYQLRGYELPKLERSARGTALVNLIPLADDERINSVMGTRDFHEDADLVFFTRNGMVKRTQMAEYARSRRDGIIAIDVRPDDELVSVVVGTEKEERDCVVFTREGQVLRFPLAEVRRTGRATAGVRAIRLAEGDEIVAGGLIEDGLEVLMVTSNGYGKRTPLDSFPAYHRAASGVRGIGLTKKKGVLVTAEFVRPEDEVLIVSSAGQMIRVRIGDISNQGRYATGVKLMSLQDGETVTSVGVVAETNADM